MDKIQLVELAKEVLETTGIQEAALRLQSKEWIATGAFFRGSEPLSEPVLVLMKIF